MKPLKVGCGKPTGSKVGKPQKEETEMKETEKLGKFQSKQIICEEFETHKSVENVSEEAVVLIENDSKRRGDLFQLRDDQG